MNQPAYTNKQRQPAVSLADVEHLTFSTDVTLRDSLITLFREMPHIWQQEIESRRGLAVSQFKESVIGGKEVVTEADIQASLCLLETIRPFYPDSISEEHLTYSDRHAERWVFDPLDGTACFQDQEFIASFWRHVQETAALYAETSPSLRCADLPKDSWFSSTMLATHFSNVDAQLVPQRAILFAPATTQRSKGMWWNPAGVLCRETEILHSLPAKKDTLRIGIAPYADGLLENTVVSKRLVQTFATLAADQTFASQWSTVELVPFGGSGAGLASVLSGLVDIALFPDRQSKIWDVAPAVSLLGSAGGLVTNFWGKRVTSFPETALDAPSQSNGIMFVRHADFEGVVRHLSEVVAPKLVEFGLIDKEQK